MVSQGIASDPMLVSDGQCFCCDPREAQASVVSRAHRCERCKSWSAPSGPVVGPAIDARIVEGAIGRELPPKVEEIEQRDLSLRIFKGAFLLDREPRHPPPARRARGVLLLCDKNFQSRFLAFLRRRFWNLLDRCELLIVLLAVRLGLLPVRASAPSYFRTW